MNSPNKRVRKILSIVGLGILASAVIVFLYSAFRRSGIFIIIVGVPLALTHLVMCHSKEQKAVPGGAQ